MAQDAGKQPGAPMRSRPHAAALWNSLVKVFFKVARTLKVISGERHFFHPTSPLFSGEVSWALQHKVAKENGYAGTCAAPALTVAPAVENCETKARAADVLARF